MAEWHMHIAWWIPKATNALSEYVIPIAFPLLQWLYEHSSMLHYVYLASLIFPCTLFSLKVGYSGQMCRRVHIMI
jgi:hypothetical protein